jgi:hypothetical protein
MKRKDIKPFRKATYEQIEERIELVQSLLSQGVLKGQIKRVILAKYGITARQCEEYISRAKDAIRKQFGQNKDQHRKDSFAFYQAIAAPGGKASPGARLRARQRIDELLGLDAPRVQQISGPEGGPIQSETFTIEKPLSREAGRKMLELLENRIGHNGASNGAGDSNGESHSG